MYLTYSQAFNGGFSLGLERAGMETVAFCEIEDFPRKVLAKHWPDVPCYADIRELTKEVLIDDGILADTRSKRTQRTSEVDKDKESRPVTGTQSGGISVVAEETNGAIATIDLICGGYPCQPFSQAGKREGAQDDRHLWPEMYRLIETVRPRWVLAENVAGHISMGLDDVLADLEAAQYAWWTFVIPACAVDARHRRDRVWIVAHAGRQRDNGWSGKRRGSQTAGTRDRVRSSEYTVNVADNDNSRRIRTPANSREQNARTNGWDNLTWCREWPVESGFCRVANGIPARVDRLKSLGNAVVPQVVEQIGRAIMEAA